ncbi:MAG: hypothetical protein MK135_04670 [Polyangiaceae bacterium]|nr:hypothetical protein [Polyangiaceae bacterium]
MDKTMQGKEYGASESPEKKRSRSWGTGASQAIFRAAVPRVASICLVLAVAQPALAEAQEREASSKPPVAVKTAASPENDKADPNPTPNPKPKPKGAYPHRPTIFHRPIRRQGFHFHASLGTGGGPDTVGLYHAMEIGGSWRGYTFALLHTFLQNKGFYGTEKGGPDEIGGFMLQIQGPIYFDDLVWKFAAGVGGEIDQTDGAFDAIAGFGMHGGVDLHFPIWPRFGPTLSLGLLQVFPKKVGANGKIRNAPYHFAAGVALGVTVF